MKAYPLAWPTGWKRTPAEQRKAAAFGRASRARKENEPGTGAWIPGRALTITEGNNRVLDQLRRMHVQEGDSVISTNLRLNLDGTPTSKQAEPTDPGVAVYWRDAATEGGHHVMAIDIYSRVADNLAAVAASFEAMRSLERHGGARVMERAFTGFKALPAPGQTAGSSWRDILNVPQGDQRLTTAEAQYKVLRSRYHPDKPTANPDMFHLVEKAWNQAQTELGNPP